MLRLKKYHFFFGMKIKLMASLLFVATLGLAILFTINYQNQNIITETFFGQKLSHIVKTTAMQIQAKDYAKVFDKITEGQVNLAAYEHFVSIQKILTESQRINELNSELIILSLPDWAPEHMIFTVMGSKKLYIGNRILRHPLAVKALNSGRSQISKVYQDSQGKWLSAFTPLLNQNGQAYAVLEGDYNISTELAATKTVLIYNMLEALAISILLAILFSYFLTHRMTSPIRNLDKAAKKMAKGDFSVAISYKSNDEIGSLINSFNHMAAQILKANSKHQILVTELETLIQLPQLNPYPVLKISREGVITFANPSAKKIDDTNILTGSLFQELAELNESIDYNIIVEHSESIGIECSINGRIYKFRMSGVYALDVILAYGYDITEERNLLQNVRDAQERSIQSERLASLGELSSGIAHEICNPLAVIAGFNDRIKKYLEKDKTLDKDTLIKIHGRVAEGVTRINDIIKSMKAGARNGENDPFSAVEVQSLMATSFDFVSEQLGHVGIDVEIEPYDQSLALECREVQISQCLIVLINNSRDAIVDLKNLNSKWIRVSVKELDNYVQFSVTDCGSGIPLAVQEKMFQSFFTTKETGKGTGLGLSITAKYIQQHNGKFYVNNECDNTAASRVWWKFNIEKIGEVLQDGFEQLNHL